MQIMAVTLEYVTLDDLSDVMTVVEQAEATDDKYGEGGTLTEDGPTRDDEMVKRFLRRAENFAENFVGTRYSIPLTNPPMMFKYVVLVIARFMLDERGDGDVSETVRESYDMAVSWLEDVRDEVVDLEDNEEFIQDYFGERTGGEFGGSDETHPFNDKSTAFTTDPIGH